MFEASPCMEAWKLARTSQRRGKDSLGGKPSEKEEGPNESFKEVINDCVNKENFNIDYDSDKGKPFDNSF